jgi:hypothetical protein
MVFIKCNLAISDRGRILHSGVYYRVKCCSEKRMAGSRTQRNPDPLDLIERIVKLQMKQDSEKTAAKGKKLELM